MKKSYTDLLIIPLNAFLALTLFSKKSCCSVVSETHA